MKVYPPCPPKHNIFTSDNIALFLTYTNQNIKSQEYRPFHYLDDEGLLELKTMHDIVPKNFRKGMFNVLNDKLQINPNLKF